MVKITIEHDGEKLFQKSGELFLGQVSSFKGCEAEASVMMVGLGEPGRVTECLAHMAVKIIKGLSQDPIIVCGSLIGLQNELDKTIHEYIQKNADNLADSICGFFTERS